MDVSALLSQIATDGDYNPYSLRNLGPTEIAAVREAALAVLVTLGEPFDHALVPTETPVSMGQCCEFWQFGDHAQVRPGVREPLAGRVDAGVRRAVGGSASEGHAPRREEDPWGVKQMYADEAVGRAVTLDRCAVLSRWFGRRGSARRDQTVRTRVATKRKLS